MEEQKRKNGSRERGQWTLDGVVGEALHVALSGVAQDDLVYEMNSLSYGEVLSWCSMSASGEIGAAA